MTTTPTPSFASGTESTLSVNPSVCESLRESKEETPKSAHLQPLVSQCWHQTPMLPSAMLMATYPPMDQWEYEPHAMHDDVYYQALKPAPCSVCLVKPVAPGTWFCSKRCSWFYEGRCAQCGRLRESGQYLYCCGGCAYQATQANWCPTCAVRQIFCGATSCGLLPCQSRTPVVSRPMKTKKPSLRGNLGEVMNVHDKQRDTVFSQFSSVLHCGLATSVLAIIKITGDSSRRKQYLNHRAQVENNIATRNVAKYGYGGEGNEQRRFFSMNLKCSLGSIGTVDTCVKCDDSNDPCDVCSVVQNGFDLQRLKRASHYCTTSPVNAASFAHPNADGVRAVILARVVIGAPAFVTVDPNSPQPPIIVTPDDSLNIHSTIVTNGDPNDDGTYVFSDAAVDAQFVILFQ